MADSDQERDARDVRRALTGDMRGFEALVARYAQRVHDLARRILRDSHEAEDAAQHAFLRAWQALERFDCARPFRNWLLRITTNLCRNRLQSRRVRRHILRPVGGDDALPEDAAPAPLAQGRSADVDLDSAIAALPDHYRLAIVLRYQQGLSLEEISDVTGVAVATVKTHLHRGRQALRLGLEGAGETPGTAKGTNQG